MVGTVNLTYCYLTVKSLMIVGLLLEALNQWCGKTPTTIQPLEGLLVGCAMKVMVTCKPGVTTESGKTKS